MRTGDISRLDAAIKAFKLALEEQTQERQPFQRAKTLVELAAAYDAASRLRQDHSGLQPAIDCLNEARMIYAAGRLHHEVETVDRIIQSNRVADTTSSPLREPISGAPR
jgi:hypothetical protein